MDIKFPERKYITPKELLERWACTEPQLRELIITKQLIPSFVMEGVAAKARFEFSEEEGYWLPRVITYFDEDEDRERARFFETSGEYFLLHPYRLSASNCRFVYFSKDRNHKEGASDENLCFILTKGYKYLDDVFNDGLIAMSEVRRFEEAMTSLSVKNKSLTTRERDTLLAIIGALLEIQNQKDVATINEILSRYPTVPGLKQRTLEGKFADARRTLKSG